MFNSNISRGTDYVVVEMAGESQPKRMYTRWFNVDRPWAVPPNPIYSPGDYESVHNIKNYFSTICEDQYEIASAECRLTGRESETFTEETLIDTGDVLHTPCTRDGLICRAEDQDPGRMCGDYSVRFICQFMGKEEPEREADNLFPEFDARIYLVLAIIPVLIFIIRLAWAYIFRQRRRQRRRARREERRRRGQARDGEEAEEEDDDNTSINSDLARPPPSYQDLFTDGTPASVFTITGRSLAPCAKCKDAQCSVVKGITTAAAQQQSSSTQASDPASPSPPASSSVADTSDSHPTQSESSTSDSSLQRRDAENIPLDTLGSSVVEVEPERSRESSSENIPESTPPEAGDTGSVSSSGETVSITIPSDSSVPADVPPPCACACHRASPAGGRGVSGYENAGFSPDGDATSSSRRGRHVPAIPRNVSDVSVLSQITLSELPSYEDALKLEKKFAKQQEGS